MKARLLACAVAGVACAFAVGAGAQAPHPDAGRPYGAQPFANGPPAYAAGPRYAVPLDQITANVRARGLEPQSRPVLRGAIYYMRAVNRARAEMRVAIDARSGRVLSATRVAYAPPAPPAAVEAAPAPPPRYEPNMSSRGYSEGAPLPPADVPVEGGPMPPERAPNYGLTSPANRPAARPPLPRSGELGEGTGSMPEAPAANPESALNAPNSSPATPVMAPIAPLEQRKKKLRPACTAALEDELNERASSLLKLRAGDLVDPLWGLLDMTPEGRGDFFPKVNYDQSTHQPESFMRFARRAGARRPSELEGPGPRARPPHLRMATGITRRAQAAEGPAMTDLTVGISDPVTWGEPEQVNPTNPVEGDRLPVAEDIVAR